jgi:hypothetical protein
MLFPQKLQNILDQAQTGHLRSKASFEGFNSSGKTFIPFRFGGGICYGMKLLRGG